MVPLYGPLYTLSEVFPKYGPNPKTGALFRVFSFFSFWGVGLRAWEDAGGSERLRFEGHVVMSGLWGFLGFARGFRIWALGS